MAGLDSTGFAVKTRQQIQDELRTKIQAKFLSLGETVNTSPSSRFGQLIDIFSDEIYLVWQGLEDVYNSYFPLTSTGTSLDKAAALTNVERLAARPSSAQAYLIGDALTAVPQGTVINVTGSQQTFFISSKTTVGTPDLSDYEIADDVNAIRCDLLAEDGTIDLRWDALNVTINWNDTPAQIKSAIENHPRISEVEVIGDLRGDSFGLNFAPAFIQIKLITTTLVSNTLTLVNNSLTNTSVNAVSTPIVALASYCSADPANLTSTNTGEIRATRGTLYNVQTSVSGLANVFNPLDATLGREKETDAEFRIRRYEELSRTGTATANGIREAVYTAIGSDIYNVSIIENDSDSSITGADGVTLMPPHSLEVFVNAPTETSRDNAIAQAIYDSKPVGIEVVSTDGNGRYGLFTDVNGVENIQMPISSTVEVPIYIKVARTKIAADYPTGGDDQIKINLVNYFSNLVLGNDVYLHRLYTPVNAVGGMSAVEIYIAKTPSPTTQPASLVIAAYELATLSIANVTVIDL